MLEPSASDDDKPLTFPEACRFLRVAAATLYRYTSTGRIAFFKPTGRTLYFRLSDLKRFVYQNRSAAAFETTSNEVIL